MTSTLTAPAAPIVVSRSTGWSGGYVTLHQGDVVRPSIAGSYVSVTSGHVAAPQLAAASTAAPIPGGSYVTLPASASASDAARADSLVIAQRAGVGAGNYISLV